MRLDAVGVPVAIARVLQVAETVQAYNLDRLMTFFLDGRRAEYPGSTRVQKRATGGGTCTTSRACAATSSRSAT